MSVTTSPNGRGNSFFGKLGLCKRCISITAAGTIVSWLLFGLLNLILDSRILLGLMLIIAAGFTILLLAHLIAYYFRVYRPLTKALKNLETIEADISISTLSRERISGLFVQGESGLAFDALLRDEELSLSFRDLQGRDLFVAQEINGVIEQSILGGQMTISFPKLIVSEGMKQQAIQVLAEKYLSETSIEGNEDVFRELQDLAEFRMLPLLSKVLGILGINGNRFPAVMSLHLLALGTFTYQQEQISDGDGDPSPSGSHPDVVYRIMHPFQDLLKVPEFGDFIDDDIVPCGGYILDEYIYAYLPEYNEEWRTGCPCECSDDKPNEDDNCYGMCGNGCTCWCQLCGDCCYHIGCALHDDWCRTCDKDDLEDCAACFSPLALIGFACWLQI